jgi:hypothetical protein
MPMDLKAWNQKLEVHFSELARDRKDIPVFALEHGLTPTEVQELSKGVCAHILRSYPLPDHRLVWIVYATEIGYNYAGDQYWQTFEKQTPGWTMVWRDWLREAFVSFQKKFAGAKPTGPWAEQFSIIAWPITHAILPRDLQRHLAQVLYDARYWFSAELFEEPQRLGDLIADRSWRTSARFQNFVQAPALVGQIAAALLLQGKGGFRPLLDQMTLQRIGDDLDLERRGREWLRGARHAAEERAKIRGLAIDRATEMTFHRGDEARAEIERLGIEPRFVLRPIEGSRWDILLEIPDLSPLLGRFPQTRDVLTESRCTVVGAAGRPLAGGHFLHVSRQIILTRWPRPDEVLLKFERIEPQFEFLLRTECMLRPGTSWLFKIASDGLAYESRSMRVRAGSKYLLMSTTAPIIHSSLTCPVELMCQGVYAVFLDIPPALTPDWEQVLRQLKLTQAKSIEVWPAGLAAIAWDGEGHGEWLASETPILAVRSDHAIDELTIAMRDDPSSSLTLTDTSPGEPIFVELPRLQVGLHRFSVAARSKNGTKSEVVGDLDVIIRVREPHFWPLAVTTHGLLDLEFDPMTPSFEQLWEGKVSIIVRGPPARQLRCRIKMFTREGDASSFERRFPSVTLPLTSEEWTQYFETYLNKDKAAQHAYDDARFCEVEFTADELGSFTRRCERTFTPLRWTLRRNSAGFVARLHNDADSGDPVVERYSFEQPAVGDKLQQGEEYTIPAGGLYVATLGDFKASIIVPPIAKGLGLAALQCEPQIGIEQRTPESVARLLSFAHLWGMARLPGDLIARHHRVKVIRAFTVHILSLIAGRTWAFAESKLKDEYGLGELKRYISDKGYELGFGAKLQLEYKTLADDLPSKRAATLASMAEDFRLVQSSTDQFEVVGKSRSPGVILLRRTQVPGSDHSVWLAEFALRMASDPVTLDAWAGQHVDAGIKKLFDVPTLARAARFLVLAVDQQKKPATMGEVYAGWGWP